jgi:hypothetical protein
MQKLIDFNDFLSDLILEHINQGELPFKLTERLIQLLHQINHKISDKLLEDDSDISAKYTLIDFDDDDEDMFTFATSAKILDYIKKQTVSQDQERNLDMFYDRVSNKKSKIWDENRSKIKIGKFINKLYPNTFINAGKPGKDIESFVNAIKSERTKKMGNFKIVSGKDIVKYYYEGNYERSAGGSSLGSSCMAGKECQPYIGFYAKNDVQLVILMSTEGDTIRGRAILWNIDELDGKKVDRKFMDRIYVIKQHDVEKFKNLAEKNGWLYKYSQDMWDSTHIVDPKDNSKRNRSMLVHSIKEYKAYPYMDTMKYFNIEEGYLTNDHTLDSIVTLESTDGGYEGYGVEMAYDSITDGLVDVDDLIWSDGEERYLNPDTAIHSEFADEWASKEYAKEHWKYSELEEDWIPEEDAIWIKSKKIWVSENYADDNFGLCDYNDEYYDLQDALQSDTHSYVPKTKAVFVITDEDVDLKLYNKLTVDNYEKLCDKYDINYNVDVRYKNDGTYFSVTDEKTGLQYHLDDYQFRGQKFAKKLKKGNI